MRRKDWWVCVFCCNITIAFCLSIHFFWDVKLYCISSDVNCQQNSCGNLNLATLLPSCHPSPSPNLGLQTATLSYVFTILLSPSQYMLGWCLTSVFSSFISILSNSFFTSSLAIQYNITWAIESVFKWTRVEMLAVMADIYQCFRGTCCLHLHCKSSLLSCWYSFVICHVIS